MYLTGGMEREAVLVLKTINISVKCIVEQAENLFILAQNLGFTLALSEGRDGGRKRS